MGEVRIGISGWTYPAWRGDFYPAGLPHRLELEYASSRLSSIEINGSFYSLQRPSSWQRWRSETPDDFVFAVKGGRFVTHLKRLRDVEAPIANFFASGILSLGSKLGPVLWQLPENLTYDEDLVGAFLDLLPRTAAQAVALAGRRDDRLAEDRVLLTVDDPSRPIRHALEFRSRTFDVPRFYRQLERHGVACVLADTAGRWPRVDRDTAGFRYARLHGDKELYASGYSSEALDEWAATLERWRRGGDAFAYFDNDAKGHAPHDARALLERFGS